MGVMSLRLRVQVVRGLSDYRVMRFLELRGAWIKDFRSYGIIVSIF